MSCCDVGLYWSINLCLCVWHVVMLASIGASTCVCVCVMLWCWPLLNHHPVCHVVMLASIEASSCVSCCNVGLYCSIILCIFMCHVVMLASISASTCVSVFVVLWCWFILEHQPVFLFLSGCDVGAGWCVREGDRPAEGHVHQPGAASADQERRDTRGLHTYHHGKAQGMGYCDVNLKGHTTE